MSMDAVMTRMCPRCREPLRADGLRGLCSKCLYGALLGEGGGEAVPSGGAVATGGRLVLPCVLGSYELLEEVARGGMGIIYRARQRPVNRLVAVKVLAAGVFASSDSLERFRTEAEAVASLDHPNIVPIYDVGELEGHPFFSMRFFEQGTLAQLLAGRRGALDPVEAAGLIVTLARAVQHAHDRGILHRDIKPGNVLLDGQGAPHLSDFSLARLLEKESSLTNSTALLGTPSYMSPEQARGETRQLTTAVDVYGLGAILYELLGGQPPFLGKTAMETVRLVTQVEPRRLVELRPGIDVDLATICHKCLRKEPEARYRSASALADDLQRWLNHEPIHARAVPPVERMAKWMMRHKAAAVAIASIAILLPGGLALTSWQAVRAGRAEALAIGHLAESRASEVRALAAEKVAREKAELELKARQSATEVSVFLMNVFSGNLPGRDPATITVAEKLVLAGQQLAYQSYSIDVRRDLLLALGRSYTGLKMSREAARYLAEYRELCLTNYGPNDPHTFVGEFLLATAYERLGRLDESRELREDLLKRELAVRGTKDPSPLHVMHVLGKFYADHGPWEKVIPLREELLRLRREVFHPDDPRISDTASDLADAYVKEGRLADAVPLYQEAVAAALSGRDRSPNVALEELQRLAKTFLCIGRTNDALEAWAKAASVGRTNWAMQIKVAALHAWLGRDSVREEMADRILCMVEEVSDLNAINCASKLAALGPLASRELRETALRLARRALEAGQGSSLRPWFRLSAGMAEFRLGQYALAAGSLAAAEEEANGSSSRQRPYIQGTAQFYRAMSLFALGHEDQARDLFAEAAALTEPPPAAENAMRLATASHDRLVLWLAFREAGDLLGEAPDSGSAR